MIEIECYGFEYENDRGELDLLLPPSRCLKGVWQREEMIPWLIRNRENAQGELDDMLFDEPNAKERLVKLKITIDKA